MKLWACGAIAFPIFLTACSTIIPAPDPPPVKAPPAPVSASARSALPTPADSTCLAQLSNANATFSPVRARRDGPGCSTEGTVQLYGMQGDTSRVELAGLGPLRCSTALAFSGWARFGVDRAARQILGSPLARIETMGSYSCRTIAGSQQLSGHAQAAAIDVSGFVLQDGRRIMVKGSWDDGPPAEREFLRVVFRSACKRFGVVLGPRYNRAHADHFHLETSPRDFCE